MRDMKKLWSLVGAGLASLTLGLGGCEDNYSASLRYGVRNDPVPMVPGGQLGDERDDPDRPGQLPLMLVSGILNPKNPYHAKVDKITNSELLRDPTKLSPEDRDKIATTLEELFGTPASPRVRGYDSEANKVIDLGDAEQKALQLDQKQLEKGVRLYRIHCVHCHGVPGDGRGPTAQWVNPHPRDFRQGLFKFQSVDQTKSGMAGSPPRREDLLRTITYGLEGSAMPAFTLLTDDERQSLVSYVIHLSLRGRAEYDTIKGAFDWDRTKQTLKFNGDITLEQYVGAMHALNVPRWLESQKPSSKIEVAAFPFDENDMAEMKKSVERGLQMFKGIANPGADKDMEKFAKATNCVSCHKDFGRQAMFRWDDWGTLVKPNNLTNGTYRAGRRPVDFYYRIHSGINGSGMAAFGAAGLPPERIWDLVNFVRTMPYPGMRQTFGIVVQ
jgi:mono/diheme cytochrome c family protein